MDLAATEGGTVAPNPSQIIAWLRRGMESSSGTSRCDGLGSMIWITGPSLL
jgi:hypothetical protein